MNLTPLNERLALDGHRRGASRQWIAVFLGSFALLAWGVLGWLPSHQAASFETWRNEAIASGETVGKVPAEIHAEWVRTGLWALFGLALLSSAWALVRLQERARKSEVNHSQEPEPATLAIGALTDTLSTLGEKVAAFEQHPAPAPPPEPPPPPPVSESLTTIAAELASDQSGVRLGALYSLHRLAQWDDGWRPAVLDIFSAYIRERLSISGSRVGPSRPTLLGGGRLTRAAEVRTGPLDLTATTALDLFLALPKQGLTNALSLASVDLRDRDLSNARLEGVDLGHSHLTNACLVGAHLEGANLSAVHGLDLAALREAHTDSETLLPIQHRREQA